MKQYLGILLGVLTWPLGSLNAIAYVHLPTGPSGSLVNIGTALVATILVVSAGYLLRSHPSGWNAAGVAVGVLPTLAYWFFAVAFLPV